MEICELSLPISNPFVQAYMNNQLQNDQFFDYNIHDKDVYERRMNDLQERIFPREELVDYLLSYHRRFQDCEKTLQNIEKLKDPKSVAVVGGQQAGLLTGPLYTIHKVLSIIALAKKQEMKVGAPVVPVFWIAGEDHDFEEINHVYVLKNEKVVKKPIRQPSYQKQMVSDLRLDHEKCIMWTEEILKAYGESEHTNYLRDQLTACIHRSNTYVEFFEELIMSLFKDEGIILVNSASKELRQIESRYFKQIFYHNKEIYDAVLKQQQFLREQSFQPLIEMQPNSTNLFIHVDEERFMLVQNEEGHFVIKDRNEAFTYEQILALLAKTPHHFSNNVVTRPLMQEMLLPTLAFIAGPGEIAYWAELKEAFHTCHLLMPPIVPRLNMTILERHIESDLKDLNITVEDVFKTGVKQLRKNWLNERETIQFEPLVEKSKIEMEHIHQLLREKALEVDRSLSPLLEKNANFIEKQLDFLHHAVQKKIKEKHEVNLKKFQRIEHSLIPNGAPQERIWNVYYYLNKYGLDFLKLLQHQTFHFNGKHKIVKI
ncbi:bacillithiol biosynthesis cysteine-adding enzyme BshC [Bacillus sp. FJAT-47783]|uniref:bacillithiol biosynthesis cysteine-adding enzyme BshC n=1 Tax=Bacillus sp. FJAT-47783 TaxID=2922712 RepID=UPI001FADB9A8|nr:bacillithiol biosynthesis cysteine-adding enzyme BshC [Bacillus sp. FJAT-47783]